MRCMVGMCDICFLCFSSFFIHYQRVREVLCKSNAFKNKTHKFTYTKRQKTRRNSELNRLCKVHISSKLYDDNKDKIGAADNADILEELRVQDTKQKLRGHLSEKHQCEI